ncbi:hypothetical protein GZ78_08170 [Endozoicomonas numazuensis]|uniref:Serine carboxypeptidase n=1 Tax=Endozoicomonas numazuensis TaxID=1137799 RepID=A0A081NGU0_9GAMM|nr:hypothetical protein GZ78_08170 [Endozoicomonas numazuensis]
MTQLPGYANSIQGQESGHLKVNTATDGGEAYLFYWFAEAESGDTTSPIVIWLNGGPGSSSLDGFFMENGPFYIDPLAMEKGKDYIKPRQYSWHKFAAYMAIDQPAGTGLSFSTSNAAAAQNEDQATEQLYRGIQLFLDNHKEKNYRARPLIIAGESFGGHYVPSIATKILEMNKDASNSNINLIKISLGNPWVDPAIQNPLMPVFAAEHSTLTHKQFNETRTLSLNCTTQILKFKDKTVPKWVNDYCMNAVNIVVKDAQRNLYDFRRRGPDYAFKALGQYMNRDDVRTAINAVSVATKKWDDTNSWVADQFAAGEQNSKSKLFPPLFESMPVLIYSGDQDMCCNYFATVSWLQNIDWSGKEAFLATTQKDFYDVYDQAYQTVRSSDNLTMFTFPTAGHLVPMDQPKLAFDMMKNYVQKNSMSQWFKALPARVQDKD